MPYRRAHLAVWLLIGLTVVALWPGYLSRLGTSVWQHHFHGVTALAWMLLLLAQSVLIDRGDRVRHGWLGRAMVVAVPLFCSAGFLVVQTMQRRTDVFRATMGDRLMWSMASRRWSSPLCVTRRWCTGETRRCTAATCWPRRCP